MNRDERIRELRQMARHTRAAADAEMDRHGSSNFAASAVMFAMRAREMLYEQRAMRLVERLRRRLQEQAERIRELDRESAYRAGYEAAMREAAAYFTARSVEAASRKGSYDGYHPGQENAFDHAVDWCESEAEKQQREQLPITDKLHPNGRCTCANEGRCWWCLWMGQVQRAETAEQRIAELEQQAAARLPECVREWRKMNPELRMLFTTPSGYDTPEWMAEYHPGGKAAEEYWANKSLQWLASAPAADVAVVVADEYGADALREYARLCREHQKPLGNLVPRGERESKALQRTVAMMKAERSGRAALARAPIIVRSAFEALMERWKAGEGGWPDGVPMRCGNDCARELRQLLDGGDDGNR